MQQLYKQWHEDVAGLSNLSQRRFGLDSPRGSIRCSAWLVLSTLLLRKSCPPAVRTTKYKTIHLPLSIPSWTTQQPSLRQASLQSGMLVSQSQVNVSERFTWEGTTPVSQKAESRRSRSVSFPPPANQWFCGDSPLWPQRKAWRPVKTGQSIWLPTLWLLHVGHLLGRNPHVPVNGTKTYKWGSTAMSSKGQRLQMAGNPWLGLVSFSQQRKPILRAIALEAWDAPPLRDWTIAGGIWDCWALDSGQSKINTYWSLTPGPKGATFFTWKSHY